MSLAIPYPQRTIIGSTDCNNARSIRTKAGVVDLIQVTFQCRKKLIPSSGIPYSRNVVCTGGDDLSSIRAEVHRPNLYGDLVELVTGQGVPHTERPVIAGGCNPRRV